MDHKSSVNGPFAGFVFALLFTAPVVVCIAALSLGWAGPGVVAAIVALAALGIGLGISNQQGRRHSRR
ncbi:MAG: LapA family protein [Mycolicibacterium cosmeticum]|nr:LapA family protein [Mycolicibacterium cosmeticum]